MLIGVDANEANVAERVGSNVFAFAVLNQLYLQGKEHQFIIYLAGTPLADLPRPRANWRYRLLPPGFFWTQWRLPLDLYLKRPRPDVFLTLGHYAPRFSPVPTAVCIMDLAFLKFPQTFGLKDLWQLKNWTEYSVRQASRIFAISQATKKDIINYYGAAADKVTVVYPGVDKLPAPSKTPVAGRYLLYVGTLQPRKNIAALIAACQDLPRKLVIAGKTGWKYQVRPTPKVTYLGYVPPEQLAGLIRGSLGLVLPSLYEGFGIPVVQAMSLGAPVLVSRNSSLTEIVGDAGLYIEPPFDRAAIRRGLEKLLDLTPAQKQVLLDKASKRARRFSWVKAGRTILTKIKMVK
jgi:glycosyltransferase involved in cell wall biosynthesis